jgi:hypothetical protein
MAEVRRCDRSGQAIVVGGRLAAVLVAAAAAMPARRVRRLPWTMWTVRSRMTATRITASVHDRFPVLVGMPVADFKVVEPVYQ